MLLVSSSSDKSTMSMTCLAFTAPAGVRVAKAAGAAAGIIVEAFVNVAVEEVVNGVV